MWFHVDAAYGGGFQLTERGHARLRGIEQADSITFDPHKSLFLPYGTGVLLVRDPAVLRAAHAGDGHYLQDLHPWEGLPDHGHLGVELTREFRGLRDDINATRRVYLSSTSIGGDFYLRLRVLSFRTHADRVHEALHIIRSAC
ncbi:pyridoxal-dependent decarboxylase [Nonomuraea sp. NPDC050383]|uniref:pyridoxal-dependent decarboxylase n=1 Tax=Nonomuraea sp. NPDC050383 TaxID=3364362 RepID=UPI0037A2DF84